MVLPHAPQDDYAHHFIGLKWWDKRNRTAKEMSSSESRKILGRRANRNGAVKIGKAAARARMWGDLKNFWSRLAAPDFNKQ